MSFSYSFDENSVKPEGEQHIQKEKEKIKQQERNTIVNVGSIESKGFLPKASNQTDWDRDQQQIRECIPVSNSLKEI